MSCAQEKCMPQQVARLVLLYGNHTWVNFLKRLTKNSTPVSKYSPDHYQRGQIQVWDFIVDQQLDFCLGNVVKYVCRAGHKPHEQKIDDLLKAKAYIDKAILYL